MVAFLDERFRTEPIMRVSGAALQWLPKTLACDFGVPGDIFAVKISLFDLGVTPGSPDV